MKFFINLLELIKFVDAVYTIAIQALKEAPGPEWVEVFPPHVSDNECFYIAPKLVCPIKREVGFDVKLRDLPAVKKTVLTRLNAMYQAKYNGVVYFSGIKVKLDHTSMSTLATCLVNSVTHFVVGGVLHNIQKDVMSELIAFATGYKKLCQKRYIELAKGINAATTAEEIYSLYTDEFEKGWPTDALDK